MRLALRIGWVVVLAACTPGRVNVDAAAGMDAGADPIDTGLVEPDATTDAGPPSCTGCTDLETGACLSGTSDTACGPEGGLCDVCGDGRECVDRECVERAGCSPDDCVGCCMGTVCVTSERDDACGAGGAACVACVEGEQCVDGVCEPTVASCGPDACAGCCDEAAACQTGDTDVACGAGGGLCEACATGWTCEAGVCVPPCAERCDGCCDGETCLTGEDDIACGFGGEACSDCGASGECYFGVCVDTTCSDTCAGCCDGDACLSGTLPSACGGFGEACVDCGGSFTCSATGECAVDPASRWNLFVLRASFSVFNPGGSLWDSGSSGRPDPYCTGEASSATGTVYSGRSATIDDTTTPVWDELLLEDVPARDLIRGITLRLEDEDSFNPDDDIGWCYWLPTDDSFSWGSVILTCPARAADPATVETELRVRLERR